MEKNIIERVLGEVKHIAKNIVETTKGERYLIKNAVSTNENTFVLKYKLIS